METLNQSSTKGEGEMKISAPAHLTPSEHSKLTTLVGRRYIVSCLLQGKKVDAPWETEAQRCIISKSWQEPYLPDLPVRDISELLGKYELDLQVANGTALLYDRWIEVQFQLLGEYGQSEPITVSILVGRQDTQESPIIGFNVIEEEVKQGSNIGTEHGMTRLVQTAFPCLSEVKAMSFDNFMQAKEKESDTGVIRVGKHDFHLAPGETVRVKCAILFGPVEEGLPLDFEPRAEEARPEGGEVKESLTRMQGGSSSRIYVPVCNKTQRDNVTQAN